MSISILLLFGLVTAAFPQFARPGNLATVFNDSAILIILALGQMAVILTRCIDLSMTANLALCGMVVILTGRSPAPVPQRSTARVRDAVAAAR